MKIIKFLLVRTIRIFVTSYDTLFSIFIEVLADFVLLFFVSSFLNLTSTFTLKTLFPHCKIFECNKDSSYIRFFYLRLCINLSSLETKA